MQTILTAFLAIILGTLVAFAAAYAQTSTTLPAMPSTRPPAGLVSPMPFPSASVSATPVSTATPTPRTTPSIPSGGV